MNGPKRNSEGADGAERDSRTDRIFARTVRTAGELGDLGWSAARNVTATLEAARTVVERAVDVAGMQATNAAGRLSDAGDDVRAYFDPAVWAEDLYARLGIATTTRVQEIDDRIDTVEIEMDHVARQRAREELLLLQQRIGELERILRGMRRKENDRASDAVGSLLGRLSELETRIDAMPWRRFEPGAG